MNYGLTSHYRTNHGTLWDRGPNPRHSMSFQCRKGLLNNPGENNCFVNSAVQVLWHLDVFRRSFRQLSGHQCMGNSCIFCALKVIFTQFQYSDQDALPPDALRKALAETFSDQERFQIGVMDDAAECFENILTRIHFHIAGREKEDMCNARHCIPHQKFAMTIVEQYLCDCGATSEPLPFSQMVHYVSTSALVAEAAYAMKLPTQPYFGQLLRNAGARGEMDKECPSKCGKRVMASRTLTNSPDVVSIGLVWDSEKSDVQHIQNVVRSIGTMLFLPDLYNSVDPRRAPDLRLVGVVCYYGKHYSTFFYNSKAQLWVYFDDATVKEIGPSWQKVADKICRGRYQPLLLLYTNPNGEAIDASTAPKFTTMVPGHTWAKKDTSPQQDKQQYHRGDQSQPPLNHGGRDFTDGTPSSRNIRHHDKDKFQARLKERRAITPNPESEYKKEVVPDTRRAITPGPESYYHGYEDYDTNGVYHERKPSYLDAMEVQGNVSKTAYEQPEALSTSHSVPYVKPVSQPQNSQYQNSNYDYQVMNGYDQADDCGTGRVSEGDSSHSLISLGNESAPMFKPVQNGWGNAPPQEGDYNSYTLSNSDQYRRPSIPMTQSDRTIIDKREELTKATEKQKKNSFKGGKGRKKVGADVIRYQTSSSFNFEGVSDKENSPLLVEHHVEVVKPMVKRVHSVDDDRSQGFVNKHDSPLTSGLATLPRNRKPKKNKPADNTDYVAMHGQQNHSDYVAMATTVNMDTKPSPNAPRVRPMSATNHSRSKPLPRSNWDEDLDEPIYIDRKAVEMILNRQNVQLKRQASSSSAASKESQDSGHHSVIGNYMEYSHIKPSDKHTLRVDIPYGDNVSIGSHKDSGYRSGDRNSASSISSISMESPTVDTVAMYVKNGPTLTHHKDNRSMSAPNKLLRNVRGVSGGGDVFSSSSVESLSSTQSGHQHVVQKPMVSKGGAVTQEMFPDAKDDGERCEKLCNYAEDLLDQSVAKEQLGDLHLALVFCTKSISYFKQALDLNPVDQHAVQHAHMKHNMCVLRSRALHRRIIAKQDDQSETSLDSRTSASTPSTEISNKSSSNDLIELNTPPPQKHEILKGQIAQIYQDGKQFSANPNLLPRSAYQHPGLSHQQSGTSHQQHQVGYAQQSRPQNNLEYNRQVSNKSNPQLTTLSDGEHSNLELRDYAKCSPHTVSDVKYRTPLVAQNLQGTLSQSNSVLEPNHAKQSSASSNSTIEVYATLPKKNKTKDSPEKSKNDIDVYRSYLSRQRSHANAGAQVVTVQSNGVKPKPTVPERSDSLSPNSTPVKTILTPNEDDSNDVQRPRMNPVPVAVSQSHPAPGDVSRLREPQSQVMGQQENQMPPKKIVKESIKQLMAQNMMSRTRPGEAQPNDSRMDPVSQQRLRKSQSEVLQRQGEPKGNSYPVSGSHYDKGMSHYDYPEKHSANYRPSSGQPRNGGNSQDYDYPERYRSQIGMSRPDNYAPQQRPYNQSANSSVPPYQPPSGHQQPPSYHQHYNRSRSIQPPPPAQYRPVQQAQQAPSFQRSISQPVFANHAQHPNQSHARRPVEIAQPPTDVQGHTHTSSYSSNSSNNTSSSHQTATSGGQSVASNVLVNKPRNRPSSAVTSQRRHPSQTSDGRYSELKVGGDLKRYKSTPSISGPVDHYQTTTSNSFAIESPAPQRATAVPSAEQTDVSVKDRLRALERQQVDMFRKQQSWFSQHGNEGITMNAGSKEDYPAVNNACQPPAETHSDKSSHDAPPPLPVKKNRKSDNDNWSQLNSAPPPGKLVEQWLQCNSNKSEDSVKTTENEVASVKSLRSKFENLTTEAVGDEISINSSSSDNRNPNVPRPLNKKKRPKRKKSVTFSDSIALITETEDVPANMEYILEWALKSQDRMKEGKYVILSKPNSAENSEEIKEKMLGYDSDCEDNTSDSCDSSENVEGVGKPIRCCLCRKKKIQPNESYCEKCSLYFARLQKSSV